MEQLVTILRSNKSGSYILYPLGVFKGYGGYVGINPCRELPIGSTADTLGEAVTKLLPLSGPTGYHIRDIESYRADTSDPETNRIRDEFLRNIVSTASMSQQFRHIEVSRKQRKKSWNVVKYRYDPDRDCLDAVEEKTVHESGDHQELGALGLRLLDED